jgi:hypothetical protein
VALGALVLWIGGLAVLWQNCERVPEEQLLSVGTPWAGRILLAWLLLPLVGLLLLWYGYDRQVERSVAAQTGIRQWIDVDKGGFELAFRNSDIARSLVVDGDVPHGEPGSA